MSKCSDAGAVSLTPKTASRDPSGDQAGFVLTKLSGGRRTETTRASPAMPSDTTIRLSRCAREKLAT